jgi:hypothetical protein
MSENVIHTHPLVCVAELTRQSPLCWKLGCSTCGALGIKSLCAIMDQDKSFSRIINNAQLGLIKGHAVYLASVQEAKHLAKMELISSEHRGDFLRELAQNHRDKLIPILASAPLFDVAHAGGFPDWLGVLGIALYLVRPSEPVTESWCVQFIEMGGSSSYWSNFYPGNSNRLLNWEDLEQAEMEQLGHMS